MTEQNSQPGTVQPQTFVDQATNQLYTVDPTTGQSVRVTDPATGQPMKADGQMSTQGATTADMQTSTSIPQANTTTVVLQQDKGLPTSGLAVAALVLGIIAFLVSFLPIANIGSIIMGLLGLVLGIIGLVGINKGRNKGKGAAIAGIVLSALALVITFFMYGSAAAIVASTDTSSSEQTTSTSQTVDESSNTPGEAAQANTSESSATEQPAAADTAQANSEYAVSIDGVKLGTDYEGKEVAIVSYTWTNNSDKATSFATALHAKAFQNNVEVDSFAIVDDLNEDGYLAEVKPGGTVSFEWPYVISDHSDLTVEVTELISFDDTVLAEQTFALE